MLMVQPRRVCMACAHMAPCTWSRAKNLHMTRQVDQNTCTWPRTQISMFLWKIKAKKVSTQKIITFWETVNCRYLGNCCNWQNSVLVYFKNAALQHSWWPFRNLGSQNLQTYDPVHTQSTSWRGSRASNTHPRLLKCSPSSAPHLEIKSFKQI